MTFRKSNFLVLYFILSSTLLSQSLDTTFVIDGKLNAISPKDTNQTAAYDAIVGFPLGSYNDFIHSNFIYQLTVSGEVTLDNQGKKSAGPVVSYVDTQYGFSENWFVLSPKDTLDFIPGWIDYFYFHAYLFDPDTIGDNSGQFYVKVDWIGWVKIEENGINQISTFKLDQNYPNPFNSNTIIRYTIDRASMVEINVFNILGKKVASLLKKNKMPGSYSVTWDGTNEFGDHVNSGIYFYQIRTNNQLKTQRMIYLK